MQSKRKWSHRESNLHLDHLLRAKPAPRPLGRATLPLNNHIKLIVLNHLPCWMHLMVRRESCMTRGVDSSKKTLNTTSGNEGKLSWDSKWEEKRWLRHHRPFMVLFTYIEKGKSYGDRLRKNGSCVLSFLNHQRRLTYTSILSVELIAKTPKIVVASGVGHLLTIVWGQQSFNVSI